MNRREIHTGRHVENHVETVSIQHKGEPRSGMPALTVRRSGVATGVGTPPPERKGSRFGPRPFRLVGAGWVERAAALTAGGAKGMSGREKTETKETIKESLVPIFGAVSRDYRRRDGGAEGWSR